MVQRYKDLIVYQKAYKLALEIYQTTKNYPKEEIYGLISQMRKAKLSVTNNIAEGYGRYHFQENMQFCRQSRGSIYELIDDFNECFDNEYIDQKYRDDLKNDGYHLIKVLNSYVASLKRLKSKSNSGS